MKNTTEIETAIETFAASARSLTDFYEELYSENIKEFDYSEAQSRSAKSDLWRRITFLQDMVEELQDLK